MKTPPITAQQPVDAARRGIEKTPAGYSSVAPLAGGILGWQQEGRSLTTGA
ncbi:MAG: hypothetical protein ACYCZD_09630 [Rhodanobacter sp.]